MISVHAQCVATRHSRIHPARAGLIRLKQGVLGLCVALLPFTLTHAATESAATESASTTPTVTANWRGYDVTFHYSSFYTYYNCDSLETKLEHMLRQLGARDDVRVSTSGCFGSNGLGNLLTSRVQVQLPAANAEATGSAQATALFNAGYQPVRLRTQSGGEVGSGDCELLEQMRDQLLPKLNLNVTQDDLRCLPGQPSFASRILEVKALVAVTDKPR